eukprot:gene3735-3996_t
MAGWDPAALHYNRSMLEGVSVAQDVICKAKDLRSITMAQFLVADGELSCHLYQVKINAIKQMPFNIACYALLTCLMAQACKLRPGDLHYAVAESYLMHRDLHQAIDLLEEPLTHLPKLAVTDANGTRNKSLSDLAKAVVLTV